MINLFQGDCLEVMKNIPTGSVDLILTDPPYGTTQCKWDSVIDFKLMWEQLERVIKPNGAIVLFGSEPFSSYLRLSNIKKYKYDWVWDKVNKFSGHLNSKKQPLKITESISVFYSNQPNYYPVMTQGKPYKTTSVGNNSSIYGQQAQRTITVNEGLYYPKNIISIKGDMRGTEGRIHPTQKPIALLEYLIKTYTLESETVLDFTMGSGSTGVAAKNLNRKFIGIELDEKYFQIAQQRINQTLPN